MKIYEVPISTLSLIHGLKLRRLINERRQNIKHHKEHGILTSGMQMMKTNFS